MKTTFITMISLLLSFSLFADITPEYGFTSIKVNRIIDNETTLIGYQYCTMDLCEQIGESEYYTLAELEKQAKVERTQIILSFGAIPVAAVAGAFSGAWLEAQLYYAIAGGSGGAVIPITGFLGLGAFAGVSPVIFTKNQRIQLKVLMLKEKKADITVKDDKEVNRYKKQLAKVLAKIDIN